MSLPILTKPQHQFSEGQLISSFSPKLCGDVTTAHQAVPRAKIFDIDGVLTNPIDKSISQELIAQIRMALFEGEFVSFNTGRSASWTVQNILQPLCESGLSHNHLNRVCAVAEKGGCWIEWKDGQFLTYKDSKRALHEELNAQLIQALNAIEPKVFEVDQSKLSMFTVEFLPRRGEDINAEYAHFQKIKREIGEALQGILKKHNKQEDYPVDVTTIAIDVQHKELGKALGSARIIDYCKRNNITMEKVLAFGDSISDIEMVSELLREGVDAHFVFVGDRRALEGKPRYPHVFVAEEPLYHQATARVLNLARELYDSPATNQDLLSVMENYSSILPGVSSWYDKRFLTAQEIHIDQQQKVIDIVVNPASKPITLRPEADIPNQSVKEISVLYKEGKIEDRVDELGVRRLVAHDAKILFSSGSYVMLNEAGEEKVILLKRSANAPVAPGLLQGTAGRCDRPIGASAFCEGLEEMVCIAEKDGKIGFLGLTDSYGKHGEDLMFDARWRAIQALRAQLKDADASERGQIKQRLELLETTTELHQPELIPYDDGVNFYRVRTWLGDQCIEDIESVHLYFDKETNTAEFRRAYTFKDQAIKIHLLEDGDGFGREVQILSKDQLIERWDFIHPPTQDFLSGVLVIKP